MIEVRRRGWVVVLAAVLVTLVGWAISQSKSPTYEAEAVLVVHAAVPLAEQPNSSSQLAATYTALIPLDRKIEANVEAKLPDVEGTSYAVANDPNTAVVRVTFEAKTSDGAIEGAKVLAQSVTGPEPVTGNVKPRTISIASLPETASKSAASSELLVVSIVLGLLLGFVLVGFWRPRDARIDTLRDLREALSCPCLAVNLDDGSGLHPLFDVLATDEDKTLAIIPCSAKGRGRAQALRQALVNAFGAERSMSAGVPGSDEAGELAAAAAEATVLVVRPGDRAVDLGRAVDLLGRYGADPAYGLLVSGDRTVPKSQSPEARTMSEPTS